MWGAVMLEHEREKKCQTFFYHLDRSLFLPKTIAEKAKLDCPLPIGFGQTISQPSLVLQMTLALQLTPDCKVLEVGTGSGYQTAFLAEFAKEVYTVERFELLSQRAKMVLDELGYRNIHFKVGDGSLGWEEHAPYQRIMVTAAAIRWPESLISQLDLGGRMVIPIGTREVQDLQLVQKDVAGKVYGTSLERVRFVELVGDYGWQP